MAAFLKIENPGAAAPEAFTLLGASTKRNSDNSGTIGKFGTGNKHGVAVLIRSGIAPVVFAGNLKLEFGTRVHSSNDNLRVTEYNLVVVKKSGKDAQGTSYNRTEDLGFVLEHGSSDWLSVDLALREFVSNSIDRAVEEGEFAFIENYLQSKGASFLEVAKDKTSSQNYEVKVALDEYRKTATDWKTVTVEVVNENQVRAKSGTTRVFIPLTAEVLQFHNDLGKWFLHFSEPDLLGKTILPKSNRNIGDRRSAVIYRRGVRVREFESSDTPSLYDYNLENLKLDESRRVDDWYVEHEAAKAIAKGDVDTISRLWQSFVEGGKPFWEHGFRHYGLEEGIGRDDQKRIWNEAFEKVAGDNAVIATFDGGVQAARKGYKVVNAPEAFVQAAEKYGIRTPSKVLSDDDKAGRNIFDSTPDAEAAVEFAWDLVVRHGLTNGRSKPKVKTFRKIMDGGGQTLGFYRDNVVYLNQDIAGSGSLSLGWHSLTQQLQVTALEEVSHHVTGATDNSRDFQDFLLNLIVYQAKEAAGI